MVELKVLRTNEGLGLMLTEEVAARLGVSEGATLQLEEEAGSFQLRPADPQLTAAMAAMDDILRRYPRTFEILSK